MGTKAKAGFEEFIDDLEQEAKASGREAVTELRSFDAYFESVAKDLRAARKAKGITQKALAKSTGIDQGEISRLENGNGDPKMSTLERAARGVGREFGLLPERSQRRDRVYAVASKSPRVRTRRVAAFTKIARAAAQKSAARVKPASRGSARAR